MDISQITAQIDPVNVLLITASVVGLTEFVKEVFYAIKNYKEVGAVDALKAPVTIAVAFIAGGLVGLSVGVNFLYGAITGLAATGLYKISKNIG